MVSILTPLKGQPTAQCLPRDGILKTKCQISLFWNAIILGEGEFKDLFDFLPKKSLFTSATSLY
jgi:hypothetical protein